MLLKLALVILVVLAASVWWRHSRLRQSQSGNYGPQGARRPSSTPISTQQAYAILGLEPTCTAEDVRRSHRHLMSGVHPDRGGSDYLASQLNEARELLLALKTKNQ